MKLVNLVFFLLVSQCFLQVKEMVVNGRRIDLQMDYTGPHPRPPITADRPTPRDQDDEVVTKEGPVYTIDDYLDPAPVPVKGRPRPYESSPPPPPHPPFTINN